LNDRKQSMKTSRCFPSQVDTNRLDVKSLVGLFYMLLLAVAMALLIAAAERIVPHALAACPGAATRLHQLQAAGGVFGHNQPCRA